MSKINKIRFVNLNYNNNTMKIDNESFYLNGENTMLNLRNGGGKSVIVQMIMAPFVNRRHRNLKDRSFDSYFTSAIPTYILIEWKLDDDAGYLLTGMMVRKRESSSDENSKEKLEIINFISEYKVSSEYDIDNLPIIEEKNERKVIKSFLNAKKLFEDLKKDRELKFNYYDMNNSIATRSYFSKLEEYKINYKEWETIIKQINLKESGLSELFTKAKDSNGLVKEWFLPAIENKLKKDEDRIKNYRELIYKYIKQYRANKSNIDKKEKIELFNELSKELYIYCDEFIDIVDKKFALENEVANIIAILRESLHEKEKEDLELEKLIKTLENNIEELKYEEDSIKVYDVKDKIRDLEENLYKIEELIKDSEIKKERLKKYEKILECAKIHRDYQKASEDLLQLETELEILNRNNEDTAPHINNLGFTIKGLLEREIIINEENESIKSKLKKELVEEEEKLKDELRINRKNLNNLKGEQGSLKAQIKFFDEEEERFNELYEVNLFRNITNLFDDDRLIEIDRNISNHRSELEKEIKGVAENILSSSELLKSKKSEKVLNTENIWKVKSSLENKSNEIEKQNNEIEKRKEAIKYIDFSEDKVFCTEEIVSAFDRKINFLKAEEGSLNKKYDNLLYELEKLKTGKVLELPKEIEARFKEKDINIIYGMDWLKRNGYSFEKNEEIIRNNPFIPYSLIMDSREIEILEKESLDIFTSIPISIINRVDLEKINNKKNEDIVELNGIRFFVSFNNKLLNEEELLKLINNKEFELKDVNDKLTSKKEDIKFYEEKRNFINYSFLKEKEYNDLKAEIINLKDEDIKLREYEISLEKDIHEISSSIKKYEEIKRDLEKEIEKNSKMDKEFKELRNKYEKYKKDRLSLDITLERIKILENNISKDEKRSSELSGELKSCEDAIRHYIQQKNSIKDELIKFTSYNSGIEIKKDKEDLLSEFNALTKEINSTETELRNEIIDMRKTFSELEDELDIKSEKYKVKESDYINEVYNIHKELEIKDEYTKEDKNYEDINEQKKKIEIILAVEKRSLDSLYKKIKDDFDKKEPKSKELLFNKNFKEDIAKLRVEIKDVIKRKKQIDSLRDSIKHNLSSLNEFNNLTINNKINIEIDFEKLSDTIGKLKRDLNTIKSNEIKKENKLKEAIMDIENNEYFKNESLFKNPIQTLRGITNRPIDFKAQLNLVVESYNFIMKKLISDIDLIEKEENKILESILEYIEEVHLNIEKIDDNSSITLNNKRLKMLNIKVADWEVNKEVYKIRLKDYVDRLKNESIKALERNNSIEDIISNKINSNKLYDEVVGISSVNIKLYKIEEDKQRIITWDEVSKNSGGEGFLSAFVILSSLLSYMRKDEDDIFSRKESGKVLIMDNPFAQTSSAHLLKPLMDVAKKSNTQLICLTGLGGDSIYNRFDNIYVLNLISSKLRSGVKNLVSDHVKGEDEEREVMVSSRFRIEDQTRLF